MAKFAGRQFDDVFPAVYIARQAVADPASLADGAGVSTTITVPGAALGDVVIGVSFSVSTQGMTVTANVTAANTVIVRLQNESGGAVDLTAYTITIVVAKVKVF